MISDKEIQEARDRFADEEFKLCPLDISERDFASIYRAAFENGLEIGRELGMAWAFEFASRYVYGDSVFDNRAKQAEERARKLMGMTKIGTTVCAHGTPTDQKCELCQ